MIQPLRPRHRRQNPEIDTPRVYFYARRIAAPLEIRIIVVTTLAETPNFYPNKKGTFRSETLVLPAGFTTPTAK